MSEPPVITPSGEYLYNRVLPLFNEDEKFGFFGRLLVDAVMAQMQGMDQILLDQPEVVPSGVGVANLVVNPSFRHDTIGKEPLGWTVYGGAGYTSLTFAVQRTITGPQLHSLRVTETLPNGVNGFGGARSPSGTSGVPVVPGVQYSARAFFNALSTPSGSTMSVGIDWYGSAGAFISESVGSTVTKVGAEQPSTVVGAFAPPSAAFAAVHVNANNNTGSPLTVDFQAERIELVPGASVKPYFDGDTTGAEWANVPGNSTTLFVEASGEHPGWTTILDPRVCPEAWLPWCAQLYGVELPPNATVREKRNTIIELVPQKRSTPGSILRVAESVQKPGSLKPALLERQNASGEVKAYWFTLVVKAPTFKSAITIVGKTESGSKKVKGIASTKGIEPGAQVQAGTFASGTTVKEVNSENELTMTNNASSSVAAEEIVLLNPNTISSFETEVLREKAAGLRWEFVFGKRYKDLEGAFATYKALEEAYPTYAALESAV